MSCSGHPRISVFLVGDVKPTGIVQKHDALVCVMEIFSIFNFPQKMVYDTCHFLDSSMLQYIMLVLHFL